RDQAGREQRLGFIQKIEAGDVVLLIGRLEDLERARLDNLPHSKTGFLQSLPPQRVDDPFNTVIVCGIGQVGIQVIRLLLAHAPRSEIVAICLPDTPTRIVAEIERRGVRVVRGDARHKRVLREAGLERAYTVASLYSSDLLNVQVGLAARSLRPDIHLVLRVFSDVLAERLSALFGINTAYSTSALSAPALAAAAVLYDVGYAFDVADRLFATRAVIVGAGDAFDGLTIGALRERNGLLAITLRRDGTPQAIPPLDMPIRPGDELVLLGDLRALAVLHAQCRGE
ncbi:MAG: potassium transporter TrkA, partial [Oscillochloris sp.]|nr:potassium transporter TrkA [Oscillochloris sp.]